MQMKTILYQKHKLCFGYNFYCVFVFTYLFIIIIVILNSPISMKCIKVDYYLFCVKHLDTQRQMLYPGPDHSCLPLMGPQVYQFEYCSIPLLKA